jgi:hypothetical protein
MNNGEGQPTSDGRLRSRRRWRRGLIAGAAVLVVMLLAAEIVLRTVFGLGDPPLLDRDPAIEYLYKPSRRYSYLKHTIEINSHSMRSPEFPVRKSDPDELRVLVIGDSIVTGGGRIDQRELATERLRASLQMKLSRPVVVGNVACGSWGPPNQLAYLRRFGLFEADVVIVVTNGGDLDDVPGLEPLGAAWPRSTPPLAMWEPMRRATERVVPGAAEALGLLERGTAPGYDDRVSIATTALREMVAMVRAGGARIGVLQYLKLSELRSGAEASHQPLRRVAEDGGARVWSTVEGTGRFTADSTLFLPGDDVHPSAAGQARLAERLEACVLELLGATESENGEDPAR